MRKVRTRRAKCDGLALHFLKRTSLRTQPLDQNYVTLAAQITDDANTSCTQYCPYHQTRRRACMTISKASRPLVFISVSTRYRYDHRDTAHRTEIFSDDVDYYCIQFYQWEHPCHYASLRISVKGNGNNGHRTDNTAILVLFQKSPFCSCGYLSRC
ncbi:hypothetical protein TNCV_1696471 [Trichonephila clavipes]|nr:hypothetical protein TNCV_1696471 [Trichonephila clavipes]